MTDKTHLVDDTWTTVDENNNREPRKLTVISSEPTSPKPTTFRSESDAIETNNGDNPGDFFTGQDDLKEFPSEQSIDLCDGSLELTHEYVEAFNTTIGKTPKNNTLVRKGIDGHNKSAMFPVQNGSQNREKSREKSEIQELVSQAFNKALGPGKANPSGRDRGKWTSDRPGSPQQPKRDASNGSQNSRNGSRSRSRSTSKKKHCIEVQQRKNMGSITEYESPYACNIVELPQSDQSRPKLKQKVFLTNREHSLLSDQISRRKKSNAAIKDTHHTTEASHTHNSHIRSGNTNHLDNYSICSFSSSEFDDEAPMDLMTDPIPLKSWPTFDTLHSRFFQPKDTQTQDGIEFQEAGFQVDSNSSLAGEQTPLPTTNVLSSHSQTDINALEFKSLEKLASKLEQGVFSASEACTVLIHTIFKESVGNATAAESVLRLPEFQKFLNSSNEIQALDNVSTLLRSTCRIIDQYIGSVKEVGITFPDDTKFSQKSSRILSLSSIRSAHPLVKQEKSTTEGWNNISPVPSEHFELSLFQNPETGDIIQTLSFQDHIFHTRYASSEGPQQQIRNIASATREKVGIAFINSDRLMDTVIRCSSVASTRITVAKSLLSKGYRNLITIATKFTKPKYNVKAARNGNLAQLSDRLQKLNTFVGVVYQLTAELHSACKMLESAIGKSMNIQQSLKFPRIPGFSKPNKRSSPEVPLGTQLPIQDAMLHLTDGIKGIDTTYDMAQLSISSLEAGIKSKREYKHLLQDYLEGIKILGTSKDIDFGSLLMTLLCSTEMINFYEDEMPSTDPVVRAAVVTLLGKLDSGTKDLITVLKRIEADSHLLAVQSMGRLKEVRERQSKLDESESGIWTCFN